VIGCKAVHFQATALGLGTECSLRLSLEALPEQNLSCAKPFEQLAILGMIATISLAIFASKSRDLIRLNMFLAPGS